MRKFLLDNKIKTKVFAELDKHGYHEMGMSNYEMKNTLVDKDVYFYATLISSP